MTRRPVKTLRNAAFIAHGGAGKTSLCEAILFNARVTDRLGRVDDGTAFLDFDPDEQRRKISLQTSVATAEYGGHRLTLIDTPGYFDFVGEVRAALRVADAAVIVVDAVSGVEVGTEMVWRYADEMDLPRLVFLNRLDRENANFARTLDQLQGAFQNNLVPVALPIGAEAKFTGVVDLIAQEALTWAGDGSGEPKRGEIPADLADAVATWRERLVEAAAEGDDALLEKYLEGEALSPDEVRQGLRQAVLQGRAVPVLAGSSTKNVGVTVLAAAMAAFLPSPEDRPPAAGTRPGSDATGERRPEPGDAFSALVWKTMADPFVGKLSLFRVYSGTLRSDGQLYNATRDRTERVGQLFLPKGKTQEPVPEVGPGEIAAVAKLQETTTGDTLADPARPIVYPPVRFPSPVFSVAVAPKAKGDEEKISAGLARLSEEDPTLVVRREASTGQMILSGMGELHVDVITDRLKRKFGVDVVTAPPEVPYKETIRGTVKVEGKYKKQTGGRGQYGHVWLELEPFGDGEYEFVDKIFGGVVPQQYRPAVDKGVREAMQEGVLAGYPVTGLRVKLVDGSYHTVDSSEMAFKIAGSMAFKKGVAEARPVLLEPIVKVEVTVPDQYMGDIMGDLNKKRGKVQGMEPQGTTQVIRALVPMAEMFGYAIDLRSMTQGRATYTMEPSHYEEVPAQLAQQIIERRKAKGA